MVSSIQQPISLRTDDSVPVDYEIAQLIQELQAGRFEGLREFLSRTRASGDWQDRIHVLVRVAPKVSIDALDAACAVEPTVADLLVTRCAYYAELAGAMRGTGTADQVGSARFQNAADCVRAALSDMSKSAQLDSQDPTVYTLILKPLTIFSQADLQKQAFAKAVAIAPDLVPAHFALISALSKRWGGSHEASLSFARKAMTKTKPGSDMAACLFWAHTLVRTHFLHFDKDIQAVRRYGLKPDVVNELNAALDNWLVPSFVARRSSIPFLHRASEWYRASMDEDRLKRVIAFTGEKLDMLPRGGTLPRRTNSASKGGGGLLGWIFGDRR
jgi:hypothetical protein